MDNKQKLSTYVMIEKMKPLKTRLTSKQVLNNFEKLTTTNKGKNQDALREEAIKQYENAVSTNKKISRFSLQWEGKTLKDKRKPELKTVAQLVHEYNTSRTPGFIDLVKKIHEVLKSPNEENLTITYMLYKAKEQREINEKGGLKAISGQVQANVKIDPKKYNLRKGLFIRQNDEISFWEAISAVFKDPYHLQYFAARSDVGGYIEAVEIKSFSKGEINVEVDDNYLNEMDLMDSKVKYIFSQYVKTEINDKASEFSELFKIDHEYKLKNSCVINCILNKLNPVLKRDRKKTLTRESILKLIKREDLLNKENTPLSLKDIIPFFESKKINFTALDSLDKVLAKVIHPRNDCSKLGSVVIVCNNGHCELVNELKNTKKIGFMVGQEDYENSEEINISDNYFIAKNREDIIKFKMFDGIDQLKDIIMNNKGEEDVKLNLVCVNDNLDNMALKMYCDGICPKVSHGVNGICSIYFKIGNISATISSQQLDDGFESKIVFNNIEAFQRYYEANKKFSENYLKNIYKSDYNKDDYILEKELAIRPRVINFVGGVDRRMNELDMNKCYTRMLMMIKKVPVFNVFDKFERYNGGKIEDLNYYVIKAKSLTVITTEKYVRLYGFVLKMLDNYKILYVKRPSSIIDVDFASPVKDLYKTKILNEEYDKKCYKSIVNIMTGKLEKKNNTTTTSLMFTSAKEAVAYKNKYGGQVFVIQKQQVWTDLDQDTILFEDDIEVKEVEDEVEFYVVDIKKSKELVNGFKYIKELIYSLNDVENLKMYNKLTKSGIKPACLKTDAFYVHDKDVEKILKWDCLGKEIGQYKIQPKMAKTAGFNFSMFENNKPYLIENKVESFELINEYDIKEAMKILLQNKVLVEGLAAGVGKSTLIKLICEELGKRLLYITPNNKLAEQLESTATTLHKLLGIIIGKEEEAIGYDIKGYDVICFDEIYFHNPCMLKRIKFFMDENPEKIYCSTGDTHQLEPVELGINNVENYKEYISNCVGQVFNKKILLKEVKRCRDKDEGETMINLRDDILNENLEIETTLKKYGIKTIEGGYDKIVTDKVVCYYNEHAKNIGAKIHFRTHTEKYEVGINLVLRKSNFKDNKKQPMIMNNQYKIIKIGQEFILRDLEGDDFYVSKKNVDDFFLYAHCITAHSSQGLTINEEITIVDIDAPYISRQWIYVALTRTRSLKDITVYFHSEEEIDMMFNRSKANYFYDKVEGYKSQDKRAGRKIEGEYVNTAWFFAKLRKEKHCSCGDKFYYICLNGRQTSNITANRIDNSLCHSIDNIELKCVKCNVALSDN